MSKKFTDILSPGELSKREIREEIEIPEKKPRFKFKIKKPEIKFSLPPLNKGIISLIVIVIIIGGIFSFTLSKAEIAIWPETDDLTLQTKLTVDKNVEKPNFAAKVIPGEVFEKEKTITSTFPATGSTLKEGKSHGTVTVYNTYSTYPQVLVERTRFVSANGEVFRTPIRVTVPGGTYQEGKLVPGEIEVEVEADQPGPEYNIEPTTFSIPGFAGTDRYTKFYAKSFQAMSGGSLQQTAVVLKADIEAAEASLVKQAREGAEASLKNELNSGEISSQHYFLEESIKTEILEEFSLVQAGEEVAEFKSQAKAKSETLLFGKEDLFNFAKEALQPYLPEDMELYSDSLKIDYYAETINLDSGKIILSLEIAAKAYSQLDVSNLKNNLGGKSAGEAKLFLENQPKITKVEVNLSPFWAGSVPSNPEKIKLNLEIDLIKQNCYPR